MQFSMLPFNTISANQWFELIVRGRQEDNTYIYEVTTISPTFNASAQEEGYYVRASQGEVEDLKNSYNVRKLSFAEVVHISDCLYSGLTVFPPSLDVIKELIGNGGIARYFEELEEKFPSPPSFTLSLKMMSDRVNEKYFGHGWRSLILSFFSAIANFYLKYNLYMETGVRWPGNTCSWVDKVINQIKTIQKIYLTTLQVNREILHETMNIPLADLEKMTLEDVKALRRKAALKLHPDRHPNLVEPHEKEKINANFDKVYKVISNFEKLLTLRKKFFVEDKEEEKQKLVDEPLAFRATPIVEDEVD